MSQDEVRRAVMAELNKPDFDPDTVTVKGILKIASQKLGGVDLKPHKGFIKTIVVDFLTGSHRDDGSSDEHKDVVQDGAGKKEEGSVTAAPLERAQSAIVLTRSEEDALDAEEVDPAELSESDFEDGHDEGAQLASGSEYVRRKAAPRPKKKTNRAARDKSRASSSSTASSSSAMSAAEKAKIIANAPNLTGQDRVNTGKTAYTYELELSDTLAHFFGCKYMTRSDATKKIWAYCNEHDLPKAKGGKRILDEKLATALGRKTITFTTLAKALKAHMKRYYKPEIYEKNGAADKSGEDDEGDDDDGNDDGDDGKPAKKKPKKEAAKKGKKKQGGSTSSRAAKSSPAKAKGGLAKVMTLSLPLTAVVGDSELARTEVVKRLWAYIKENNLQNPKNRKEILCDEKLEDVFNQKKIDMFQMNRLISAHME